MSGAIFGNMIGGTAPIKTVKIIDNNNDEILGVVTGSEVIFTAKQSDVKIGKIAAIDEGVIEGTDTKTYRTTQGSYAILPGATFSIPLEDYDKYDYTKFQCLIAHFNTTFEDSVSTDKVSINDYVHPVNSVEVLSNVTKNLTSKSVDLNITNNTENVYIVHYFTYKEEG